MQSKHACQLVFAKTWIALLQPVFQDPIYSGDQLETAAFNKHPCYSADQLPSAKGSFNTDCHPVSKIIKLLRHGARVVYMEICGRVRRDGMEMGRSAGCSTLTPTTKRVTECVMERVIECVIERAIERVIECVTERATETTSLHCVTVVGSWTGSTTP